MEKWFFSDNGKVTAPLDLDAAKAYLTDNPNVYGWHPSFTQWKPASCILEFADVVPPTDQASAASKELTEKFLAKKQRLETKLTSIDDSINHTQSSLSKFQKQIVDYKELTQNLNDDVKTAIANSEKRYSSLNKKLSQLKNAVHIAEVEINDAIEGFDQRLNSNDVFMPSCHQTSQVIQGSSESDEAKISKAKRAQEKLATPHKRVEVEKPKEDKVVAKKPKEIIPPDAEYANKMATESMNSMKNMMKSVFKGDKKVEQKAEPKVEPKAQPQVQGKKAGPDEPLSMAERLKRAQNNT